MIVKATPVILGLGGWDLNMTNTIRTGLLTKEGTEFTLSITAEMKTKLRHAIDGYNEVKDVPVDASKYLLTTFANNIMSGGNTTVADTIRIVEKGQTKTKEQKTVLNTYRILTCGILEVAPLNIQLIVEIWRRLVENTVKGVKTDGIRHKSVQVGKQGIRGILKPTHIAPKYTEVERMLQSLIEFTYRNDGLHPFIKAAIFNAYFVYVHPFMDGNGRTSRLLMNKLLIEFGLSKFRYLSLASEIVKDKVGYCKALEEIEKSKVNDMTPFVEQMLTTYVNLFNRAKKRFNVESIDDISRLNRREVIMLEYIKNGIGTWAISDKEYKEHWNKQNSKFKITLDMARVDLSHLMREELVVIDIRYTKYTGYIYWKRAL